MSDSRGKDKDSRDDDVSMVLVGVLTWASLNTFPRIPLASPTGSRANLEAKPTGQDGVKRAVYQTVNGNVATISRK